MKQMKNLLALFLSLALCMGFAACGGSTEDAAGTGTNTNGGSSADYYVSAVVYQSGSTVEASISGTFVEDFLALAEAGKDCQLNIDFETDEGISFCFTAFGDGEYVSASYYNFETDESEGVDTMYGGGSMSLSFSGYTGDFSAITELDIYMFEGDEYIDGDGFDIADVMISESIFGGSGSASSGGDAAVLAADSEMLTMTFYGEVVNQLNYNVAANPAFFVTLRDASGTDLAMIQITCFDDEWSAGYNDLINGTMNFIDDPYGPFDSSFDRSGDALVISFDYDYVGLDIMSIASLSVDVSINGEMGDGVGYWNNDYPFSFDTSAYDDAQSALADAQRVAYVGTYYVYNRSDYNEAMTITSDSISFIHNGETYTGTYDPTALETTYYGDNCACFTYGEDNIIVRFQESGDIYASVYINCLDTDTGESAGYEYRREDDISTVDSAFAALHAGDYVDIESGNQRTSIRLGTDGSVSYTNSEGIVYTADSIVGCTLVDGDTVYVSLVSGDGTVWTVSIRFMEIDGVDIVRVNNGWNMG